MPDTPYRLLLCDADNTLFDFSAAEKAALYDALASCGLPVSPETAKIYSEINLALWKAFERGEITQGMLRIERFRRLLGRFPAVPFSAEEVGLRFTDSLGQHAFLMDGALVFVQAIHARMPIALVTNGIAEVQRGRLGRSAIAPYIDFAVISGEIGSSKPDPEMLYIAMERAGVTDKSQVILLGDSLTADIEAARRAGITSIHLCGPGGKQTNSPADFQAETLEEARRIILND